MEGLPWCNFFHIKFALMLNPDHSRHRRTSAGDPGSNWTVRWAELHCERRSGSGVEVACKWHWDNTFRWLQHLHRFELVSLKSINRGNILSHFILLLLYMIKNYSEGFCETILLPQNQSKVWNREYSFFYSPLWHVFYAKICRAISENCRVNFRICPPHFPGACLKYST